MLGLFLDGDDFPVLVELHYPGALRILHLVGKNGCAGGAFHGGAHVAGQIVAVENVVAEDQRAGAIADEIGADDKSLRQAIGASLHRVGNVQPPLLPVAQ